MQIRIGHTYEDIVAAEKKHHRQWIKSVADRFFAYVAIPLTVTAGFYFITLSRLAFWIALIWSCCTTILFITCFVHDLYYFKKTMELVKFIKYLRDFSDHNGK